MTVRRFKSALAYLLHVVNDDSCPTALRIRAAVALLPYQNRKASAAPPAVISTRKPKARKGLRLAVNNAKADA